MNALVYSPCWRRKLSPKLIWLEPEHFEKAKIVSTQNLCETSQWKIYLNALALLGFEQWLREKTPDININRDHCSGFQPDSANELDVVCN